MRPVVAALCALAVVLTSAWSAPPAPAPAQGSTVTDPPPGGVPGVLPPTIRGADAGDGYQQATAQLPYDYTRPRGATIGFHLVRLPATDVAHRIGSLFVNPGEPGEPADAFLRTLGKVLLPAEVLARYHLVGVDPRGTGKSRPVRCSGSTDELQTPARHAARPGRGRS
jgi:hypothetical protein